MDDPAMSVHGAVLVGGSSLRMGRPKAGVTWKGKTLVEWAVHGLEPHVENVVLVGGASLPRAVGSLTRLDDVPGAKGPLGGILAALAHRPQAAWVVLACDLPRVTPEAVAWLLAERVKGSIGVMPRTADGNLHPLFALYEPQASAPLRSLASSGKAAPRRLATMHGVHTPRPPLELEPCWTNANRPGDLAALKAP